MIGQGKGVNGLMMPLSRRRVFATVGSGAVAATAIGVSGGLSRSAAAQANVPAGAMASQCDPDLRRIMPSQFGPVPGQADATVAIAAMFARMQGTADSGKYVSYWPYGVYRVSQIRFDLMGTTHLVDGAIVMGTSTQRQSSVVDLRCGHSLVRGLRVVANFSTTYACGVQHYTNDLSRHYPGFLDVSDLQVEAAQIGLVIGALPSQPGIGDQSARAADNIAIDAPLSEVSYLNVKLTNCACGLFVRQPNGKVTIVGGRIHSESGAWKGFPPDRTWAITVANPGSEVNLVGGTLEHVQGKAGNLAVVTAGKLTVSDAAIETTVPSFLAGSGSLTLDRVANNGINSQTHSYVEIDARATGQLQVSRCFIAYPPLHLDQPGAAVLRSCAGPGGRNHPNPGFCARFNTVELRDPAVAFTGAAYRPLAHGIELSLIDCALTSLDVRGQTLMRKRLHDGAELLAGRVDQAWTSWPQRPVAGQTYGGWTLRAERGGRAAAGTAPPPATQMLGEGQSLVLAGNGGLIELRSALIPVKRDGLLILRSVLKVLPGPGQFELGLVYTDLAGTALGPEQFCFSGPVGQFDSVWQPAMFLAEPRGDAAMCRIVLRVSGAATVTLGPVSVR